MCTKMGVWFLKTLIYQSIVLGVSGLRKTNFNSWHTFLPSSKQPKWYTLERKRFSRFRCNFQLSGIHFYEYLRAARSRRGGKVPWWAAGHLQHDSASRGRPARSPGLPARLRHWPSQPRCIAGVPAVCSYQAARWSRASSADLEDGLLIRQELRPVETHRSQYGAIVAHLCPISHPWPNRPRRAGASQRRGIQSLAQISL